MKIYSVWVTNEIGGPISVLDVAIIADTVQNAADAFIDHVAESVPGVMFESEAGQYGIAVSYVIPAFSGREDARYYRFVGEAQTVLGEHNASSWVCTRINPETGDAQYVLGQTSAENAEQAVINFMVNGFTHLHEWPQYSYVENYLDYGVVLSVMLLNREGQVRVAAQYLIENLRDVGQAKVEEFDL